MTYIYDPWLGIFPRPLSAVIVVTALLLAAASCGRPVPGRRGPASMPVARHAMAARPGLLAGGQRGLSAISASFISASAGWLLAVPPCAGYVRPCQTLLLRKTTDGGRTWVAVPAPPAPDQGRPGAVSQILFISSRDGWAWGPGLWQTRDGGARWRRVSIGGGPVQSLAVAGGRVLAAAGRCGQASPWQCRFQVYASPARIGRLAAGPRCGRPEHQPRLAGRVRPGRLRSRHHARIWARPCCSPARCTGRPAGGRCTARAAARGRWRWQQHQAAGCSWAAAPSPARASNSRPPSSRVITGAPGTASPALPPADTSVTRR